MVNQTECRDINILLVEDNAADARLTEEVFKECKVCNKLHHVVDGVEAIRFLQQLGPYEGSPRPDLILLDLNLPKMNGREVLRIIKADPNTKRIPVVVLSASEAEEDIMKAYDLNASCYVKKPIDLDQFVKIVKSMEDFWLSIVKFSPE